MNSSRLSSGDSTLGFAIRNAALSILLPSAILEEEDDPSFFGDEESFEDPEVRRRPTGETFKEGIFLGH